MFDEFSAFFIHVLLTSSFVFIKVTVWGDYGRIEGKKVFMGVAQIMLDDLNLSNIVIGWYKLFGTTSLVIITKTMSRNTIDLNKIYE